jgi:arginase family enzyme
LLGGGHDGAYASHSALLSAQDDPAGRLWTISVDSRLDAEPLMGGETITSGTALRRLRDRWGARFGATAFGLQQQHVNAARLEWARQRGWPALELRRLREEIDGKGPARLRFYKQLTVAAGQGDVLAVSLDLSAVEAASAPGVSAPNPDGFSPGELLAFARIAGGRKAVKVLDVMECAPPLDQDGRTARLGAAAVWSFLAGVCLDR